MAVLALAPGTSTGTTLMRALAPNDLASRSPSFSRSRGKFQFELLVPSLQRPSDTHHPAFRPPLPSTSQPTTTLQARVSTIRRLQTTTCLQGTRVCSIFHLSDEPRLPAPVRHDTPPKSRRTRQHPQPRPHHQPNNPCRGTPNPSQRPCRMLIRCRALLLTMSSSVSARQTWVRQPSHTCPAPCRRRIVNPRLHGDGMFHRVLTRAYRDENKGRGSNNIARQLGPLHFRSHLHTLPPEVDAHLHLHPERTTHLPEQLPGTGRVP